MPGRASFGRAGKWIHDRAHHIMGKNPEMPKGMAYAVATQQGHKVGKSPKKFRTKEGVRMAKAKHPFPKSFYKKTASDKRVEIAFIRLKELQKEAAKGSGKPSKRSGKTRYRGGPGNKMRVRKRGTRREFLKVPRGSVPTRRSNLERRILGPRSSVMRGGKPGPGFAETVTNRVVDRFSDAVADRIRYGGKEARPMPEIGKAIGDRVEPGQLSKLMKNPTFRKALRYGGLGALGLGAGAAAHQLAHSVGLSESSPADTLADIVVPGSNKYSHDRQAIVQEIGMYIPRVYLEKAAAAMAGALNTNHDVMHEGEPGMHGAEASVIPQQTLETAVPLGQHVDKSDEEADSFLAKMFDEYKKTSEESVGRYTRGETEIPLAKQAGRLLFG